MGTDYIPQTFVAGLLISKRLISHEGWRAMSLELTSWLCLLSRILVRVICIMWYVVPWLLPRSHVCVTRTWRVVARIWIPTRGRGYCRASSIGPIPLRYIYNWSKCYTQHIPSKPNIYPNNQSPQGNVSLFQEYIATNKKLCLIWATPGHPLPLTDWFIISDYQATTYLYTTDHRTSSHKGHKYSCMMWTKVPCKL